MNAIQIPEADPPLVLTPMPDNPGIYAVECPFSGQTKIITFSEDYDPENLTQDQKAEVLAFLAHIHDYNRGN